MNQSIKLQEKEIIKKNIPSIIYQTQCKYCQVTSFQSLYLESDSTTVLVSIWETFCTCIVSLKPITPMSGMPVRIYSDNIGEFPPRWRNSLLADSTVSCLQERIFETEIVLNWFELERFCYDFWR